MRASWAVLLALPLLPALVTGQEGEEAGSADIEEESLTAEQLRSLHKLFDANGDGRVSLAEVMEFANKVGKSIAGKDIGAILEEIDTSKDGKLTLEEHLTDIHNQADGGDEQEQLELEARKQVESTKFQAADTNGDGVLDESELPALFYPETHEGVLAVTVAETLRQKDANSDGVLSPREFWEVTATDGEDFELSEEEVDDFNKLDLNRDGVLDKEELKSWESGRFHTEEALKKLFDISDKDNDMHITADELAEAREHIAASDAQYHLIEWAEHHEL